MNQEADVHRHPPAGRVARRRVQVRGALLAAARHVLTTRGYHKTTLTEILRGSDVAAGTFYLISAIRMIFLLPWLEYDSLDIALVYARGTQSDLQQAVETIAWV